MVPDGCSAGAASLLDHHCMYKHGRTSHLRRLAGQAGARVAMSSTYSADSIVTDSAAASAAWSTGVKHNNGMLCIAPDGRPLMPMLLRAKFSGKRVGVVSTTTVTHATPAGFYCNVTSRATEEQIGSQLVERPIDVALGGGTKYVPDDLFAPAAPVAPGLPGASGPAGGVVPTAPGFKPIRTRAELAALAALNGRDRSQRVIGTFHRSHIPMVLDRGPGDVTLLEMTRLALDQLSIDAAGSDGFVLQIEGGRVDHAAHNNDAAGVLTELFEFDEVLAFVAQWAAGRDDTLVMVSTDHATGGCSPVERSKAGFTALKKLGEARNSFEWIFDSLGKATTPEQDAPRLARLTSQASGIAFGPAVEQLLLRTFKKEHVPIFELQRKTTSVLGAILAEHFGVAFNSDWHNSDDVSVLALGPGAERLPGFIDNADLSRWIVKTMGLRED